MNSVMELHKSSMTALEAALLAKRRGDESMAATYYREAYQLERTAAHAMLANFEEEPTRSVLLRSAANLAFFCKEYREAEQLISMGLAGDPPEEIQEELRDLYDQVSFERHLSLRGIELDQREFQLSLTGNEVGFGFIKGGAFLFRVESLERLHQRTLERNIGREYRGRGPIPQDIRDKSAFYYSAPRGGSFALTIRVGESQLELDQEASSSVIDELMTCLELYNDSKTEALRSRIGDDSYYTNFISLADQVAPDGDAVKFVGLTSKVNGRVRTVGIVRANNSENRANAKSETKPAKKLDPTETSVFEGELRVANAIESGKNQVTIVGNSGNQNIWVPEAIMDDVVLRLFKSKVRVEAKKDGHHYLLQTISKIG